MSYRRDQDRFWGRRPYESGNRPYERSNDWRRPASSSGSNRTSSDEERMRRRYPVSYGNKRSLSPSPPVSPSRTSNFESRRDSRFDIPPPPSRNVPATPQSREVAAGIIMNFPARFETGAYSPSAKLREQPWVNRHAPGHPVMVWDTYSEEGVQYARCLPMTSFSGKTPEQKYPLAWKHHLRYVPISQGGEVTNSRTKMPTLALAENGTMDQQTYVHLDHFFDIEVEHLRSRDRGDSSAPLRLDNDALNVLVFKLGQFIRGDIWRPEPNGQIKSPLDYESLPNPKLGRPVLEGKLKERALIGGELEAARYEKTGEREWTGFEVGESPPIGAWESEPVEAAPKPFRHRSRDTWGQLQHSLSRYAS